MTQIHSEMAVKHVQTLADGNPCILAGDFNIKPVDPMYTLLTTGAMEKDAATDVGPAYPVPKWGMEWEPTIQPMISAYAQALGKEPAFTNHARVHENEPFIDTLDYIFCSDQWKVDGVLELPAEQDESKGPFPNLEHNEASDHVLIAADLSLGS
uniref:Endonuclease/exonuclease/phosphatase domain-containing protein n=1 Tax=Craspedostauros australis TaxID=1486917 RepID=A0A7R9WSI9_9STRA|mmetsp:Transcript_16574/g.45915  ORF Transcript_16574/g.45915 Transcript_16574/m.45915 type:complete len:154 (+) Transcript_16574:14-475(+)